MDVIRSLARRLRLASRTVPQAESADHQSGEAQRDVPHASPNSPDISIAQTAADSAPLAKDPSNGILTEPSGAETGEKVQRSVALISAAAGLLGAFIGGAATFAGVVYQNNTAASGQLISEHKTLYANYDTALRNLQNSALGTEIYLKSGYPQSIWKSEDGQFRKYANQFTSWQDQVAILGSVRISRNSQLQSKDVFQLDLTLN